MKKSIKQYHETYVMTLLQIILVILKIKKIINWKWTYVLMPTWIYLIIALMLIILAIYVDIKDNKDNYDR